MVIVAFWYDLAKKRHYELDAAYKERMKFQGSEYYNLKTYSSFSGADIATTITPRGGAPLVFGELQTISYSIHREKSPVRTLGRISPKGFSKGPRTIAGSLIFTVFDKHVLKKCIESWNIPIKGARNVDKNVKYDFSENELIELKKKMKTDEMPLFDVTISLNNEYGAGSVIRIYGVTIVDEGQVMSIDDMMTEQTMSYMAMDIDLLDKI